MLRFVIVALIVLDALTVIVFGLLLRVFHRDHVSQTETERESWRLERTELLNRLAHPTLVYPAQRTDVEPPPVAPLSTDYERVGSVDLRAVPDGDDPGPLVS